MGQKYKVYSVTINPDPNILTCDNNDRKQQNKMFRVFLNNIKNNNYYKNIISVYEYGGKGKRYGKYHLHFMVETRTIRKVEEEALKIFAAKKKSNWKYTVVVKPVTADTNVPDAAKYESYRANIRYIIDNYYRKEQHNKVCCLFCSDGVLNTQ